MNNALFVQSLCNKWQQSPSWNVANILYSKQNNALKETVTGIITDTIIVITINLAYC